MTPQEKNKLIVQFSGKITDLVVTSQGLDDGDIDGIAMGIVMDLIKQVEELVKNGD